MARYRRLCHLVGLLLLICATATALKCPNKGGSPGREIVCYTRSEDLALLEDAICRCTMLIQQGHDLQNLDASDLKKLRDSAKETNPDLKVILSISDKHGLLKSSATTRQEVAAHLIDVLSEVDGMELNVTADSKDRLASFIKGLKDEMVNKSTEKMILLALPTKPEDLAKQFELKELSKYVDLFTVATHYLRDKDEANQAFHPSRLMGLFDMLNIDSIVDLISGMGAPKHKILISAPVNAYQFTLKKAEYNTPRSSTIEEQPVAIDRKKLCDAMKKGEWTVERDEDLTAPYAFKNTTWIAFEDPTSLKIKGKYIIIRELAGLGLRDVENDLKNDCGMSLAQSVYQSFTEMKRKTRDVVLSSLEDDLKGTDISYPGLVKSSEFRIVRVVDTAGKIRAIRENTQTSFTCTRQGYFVHPKSCNRFYRCVKFNQEVDDYSVFEFDCPAGLAFDEKTEVCVWPGSLSSGSACPGSSEIEPVSRGRFRCPNQPGFYVDPQNCRWFFACYDLGGPEMVPYEFRCPFGLVFDEQRLVCEWPWKVPNCKGHGDEYSIYSYGGTHDLQSGHVPQGGIIGQGGFAGQNEYSKHNIGQGIDYDASLYNGQNINTAHNADAGSINAGSNYNNQHFYTVGGSVGESGAGYVGAGIEQDGQFYSANDYSEHNADKNAKGASFNGQVYNTNDDAGRYNINYNGQNYNTGQVLESGVGYNNQGHNTDGSTVLGAGYEGQIHNVGSNLGNGYNGQTYNSFVGTGAGYNGQTYNTFNGQNLNVGIIGSDYDGQVTNGPDAVNTNNEDCNNQNLHNNAATEFNIGKDFNTNSFNSQNTNTASTSNDKGIAIESADYDDRRDASTSRGYNTAGTIYTNAPGKVTHFNTASTTGVKDLSEHTRIPSGFTIKPTPDAATISHTSNIGGYAPDDNVRYTGSITNNYKGSVTTGYAGYGRTDNANNYAGETDLPKGVTSQNKFITSGGQVTDITASTNVFDNAELTKSAHAQNTNYNTFGSTFQTGIYSKTDNLISNGKTNNIGSSTISYDNTVNKQNNIGLFETGNTEYNNPIGITTYNATYNAGAGYPTSTIIPFVARENTFNSADHGITPPVNSVVYHTHMAGGLTSTEHFGKEYTNQAENSYITQGQTPTGFSFNGQTQYATNFQTPTNIYDNSNVNLGGITPSITMIRDEVYNSGGSTNYGATNVNDNSQIIGSTINSANSDITKYQESTGVLNEFGYNSGSTFYNQQTTNQKDYTATGFENTVLNSVTPATVTVNYNIQGPSAVPSSTIKPVVELDNSDIFKIDSAGTTTFAAGSKSTNIQPISTKNTGYQTNEYYDNGGRGTIRYNNGLIANKVTDNDIQDYKTSSYTGIPNSFIINAGNEENEQSTIQKFDNTDSQQFTQGTFTKEGFTKTGPTKTGITTAQVGGSGSYVIGSGAFRPRPNPQYIGEKAFSSDFGITEDTANIESTKTTNFNTVENNSNFKTIEESSSKLETSGSSTATDFSKSNTVSAAISETTRYSYPKPVVQVEVKGASTASEITPTSYIEGTTPSSVSNYKSFDSKNSVIIESSAQNDNGFSSTLSPIGFTTGQTENFKTSVFNAVKLPQTISTVQPVINTGYQTVISSTPIPAVISTGKSIYPDNLSTTPRTFIAVGVSFDQGNDYSSTIKSATDSSDYSDNTYNFNEDNFGQKVAGQTTVTNFNTEHSTANFNQNNENSKLNTLTQDNYDSYSQTGFENTAQTGSIRINNANNIESITIPKQVYLTSSTIAPEIGVTFRKPIVSAEFTQDQYDGTSFNANAQNINAGDFNSRSSSNRILNNQAFASFASQGSVNGRFNNQASRGSSSTSLNNDDTSTLVFQGAAGKILNNQAPTVFTSQKSGFNDQGLVGFNSQGSIDGAFGNKLSVDFNSQKTTNRVLDNQASKASFSQNQDFNSRTRTLVGSNVVTSIGGSNFNNDIIRQNLNQDNFRIVAEFNHANIANFDKSQGTTAAPDVSTYSGDIGRIRSRTETNEKFKVQNQNKKVIVKLSDLHPLILGKLGAECTCKADPFAVFRGSNRQSLPIYSQNRGFVDLVNYDESDIYVDVDNDKDAQREIDLVRNIPSNRLIKTSNPKLRVDNSNIVVSSRGEASSSTYLPTTTKGTLSTYLSPPITPSNAYLPSSTEIPLAPILRKNQASLRARMQNHRQPLLIKVEDNYQEASFTNSRSRSGKTLFDGSSGSANNLRDQGTSFDRYGPGGLRSNDETLQGGLDCARPGLFRHPKYCNKFYACHWDEWKKRYTLHIFNCPVHLAFDASAGACNYPSKGPACQDNKLLL